MNNNVVTGEDRPMLFSVLILLAVSLVFIWLSGYTAGQGSAATGLQSFGYWVSACLFGTWGILLLYATWLDFWTACYDNSLLAKAKQSHFFRWCAESFKLSLHR